MKKENTKDLYERPETEEIEIKIEKLCGGIESVVPCTDDDDCPQDFE